MLSELLGKKKPAARQHSPAIAENILGVRTLHEGRNELAEEICAVLFTLKRTTRRLEEIPDALEACEQARFAALVKFELHPSDQGPNREGEFADRRAALLSEQSVLTGTRKELEGQKGQLEKQMGGLKEAIVRAEKSMWEHIVHHLAEDFSLHSRGKFLELWTACWMLRDGCQPVQALDRSFDLRLLDDATREACFERLKAEFDVPA